MSWDRLRASYSRDGLVLVLGAGVSVGSGFPTWGELLTRVATADVKGDDAGLVDELRRNEVPLTIIASILQRHSGGKAEFVHKVRHALYRDFPFFPDGVTKRNRRQLIDHVRKANPTLRAVASLCARRADGERTYSPNPRIRAIVNFNLDAVLHAYVYARYEKRLLRTIDRASAKAIPEKINVYHMHGFLRFDPNAEDPTKEAPDLVVLTEGDYFDFFNDPTSLFNYTFLYLLRECHCLFIGLSMQDGNIRRLLHLSREERRTALMRERPNEKPNPKELLRHFALLRRSDSSRLDLAMEESLLPLGTQALWVDDFEEIERRLRDVYETTGESWDSVF